MKVGQPGEIQVRSNSNFLGYWQQPDATAAAFTADGFFRTGDLGEQRTDGRIRLIGRLREMYKSGGYNVYPREVESSDRSTPRRRDRRSGVCSRSSLAGGRGRLCRAPRLDHDGTDRAVLSRAARELQAAKTHRRSPQICHCCPSARSISARYAFGPSACATTRVMRVIARWRLGALLLTLLAAFSGVSLATHRDLTFDTLLIGGSILDGTGAPMQRADLGLRDGRIAAIGDLHAASAKRRLNVAGLVITPGFIDVHSHADEDMMSSEFRAAPAMIRQGVTTAVFGIDGGYSLGEFRELRRRLQRDGAGVNYLFFIGHNGIRKDVMGMANRAPTDDEMQRMREQVRLAMQEGAVGLSSGLMYLARPVRLHAGSHRPDPAGRAFRRPLRLARSRSRFQLARRRSRSAWKQADVPASRLMSRISRPWDCATSASLRNSSR